MENVKTFFLSLAFIAGLAVPHTAQPVGILAGISYLLGAGSVASYLYQSWHPTAKDIVDRPERIRTYQITVKIKRHVKTIKQKSFAGCDCRKVIDQALTYARQEQTTKNRLVLKPSIILVADWNVYELKNIVTYSLPGASEKVTEYWDITHKALIDCLTIPSYLYESHPQSSPSRWAFYGLLGLVSLFSIGLTILFFASHGRRHRRKES